MLDRTIAPLINPLQDFELKQLTGYALDNKCSLYYLNAPEHDVLRIELVFDAGLVAEHKNGVAFFTSKMLQEGTSRMSDKQIAEKIAYYGAFLEISHQPDRAILAVYCLAKNVEQVLEVIHDLVYDSIFPEEHLSNMKHIASQSLLVNNEKTSYIASNLFKESIFRNLAYGQYVNQDAINAINRDDLLSFFSHYNQGPTAVIACGGVNDATLRKINQFFGQAKPKSLTKEAINFSFSVEKKHIDKEQSLQSSIRIGRLMIAKSHPDYHKLLIANEILGGYFGSRLMKNIREEKGLTYGIHSQIVNLQNISYLMIATDVKKEFLSLACEEIYKEIEVLHSEPVPNDELETVRNYMHGSYLGSINTPFSIADKFKSIYFAGLGYDYFSRYLHTLKHITSQELIEIYQKYFRDFTEITVG